MKAVCITACEVDGVGIVTPGEEVELPDALGRDARINTHFVIDRETILNPDAALPDVDKENAARREKFEKSLLDESAWAKALDVIIDSGREVPEDLLDRETDKAKQIKKLVDLWIEDFGYVFPTDATDDQQEDEAGGDGPKKKGKGRSGNRNRNPDADGPKGPKGTPGDRGKPADEAEPGEGEDNDAGNGGSQEDDLFAGGDGPKKKGKGRSGNRNRNPDADGPKGPKGTPGDRGKPADEAEPGEGEDNDAGNGGSQEDDLFGSKK